MNDDKYGYLFPFELIPAKARILIYGAGLVGQEYLRQLMLTKYGECVGFIDREWERFQGSKIPVYSLEKVSGLDFDYLVIAIKIATRAKVIKEDLILHGVNPDRIVYMGHRAEMKLAMIQGGDSEKNDRKLAYTIANVSIAIRLGNGLGSSIIKKSFFEALVKFMPESKIDLYSMMKEEDLQAIYGFEENLNVILHEGGSVYQENKDKYTVAVRIPNVLEVDHIDYETLELNYPETAERFHRFEEYCSKKMEPVQGYPGHVFLMRALYKKENCYTIYDYQGIFGIDSMRVKILLNEKWKLSFRKLGLKNYLTLNYGNGKSMQNERLINKQWPYEYFCKLVSLLKKQCPQMEIVQLGACDAREIEGVNYTVFGEDLEIVKYILHGSALHIDIEGGLVHLATQLGTKCIVLFGPTIERFFAYPQNINIKAGNCHDCLGLYNDGFHCARDMDRPECMYSIKPEIVLNMVKNI